MKHRPVAPASFSPRRLAVALALLVAPLALRAAPPIVLDDFSNSENTARGLKRFLVDDRGAGSQSHATQKCEGGVLAVQGELVPGRGAPAFVSVPLPLAPDGKPQDLSAYEGVRLRVKVVKGTLLVQVASAEVTNFDFHTSAPLAVKHGEFQEVRVAFKDLKRGWSEQTALNLQAVTSVNLVTFGVAKDEFAYEVDEIGFY